MAAKQALEKTGVYAQVQPRLVYGANIKDTMELVKTGNADAAILALALVIRSQGKYTLIPEELHKPLDQALVACQRGNASAGGREFAKFFTSPNVKKLLVDYGFAVPEW
jgi:molybdate transport system substrate-binding protein